MESPEDKVGTGRGKKAASGGGHSSRRIEVLLSTYNGARYIAEQLESLEKQTCGNWSLLVRDDGSTDDTPGIVEAFRARHPERVTVIDGGGKRLGACLSFAYLLERSTAPYVMFSDQDDVWLPDKIEATLERMLEAEVEHPGCPLLVHTDMSVTDAGMNVIADSFWQYQNLDPEDRSLERLLVHNNVTGCALMLNRPLAEASTPVPPDAILHDWWVALVAAGLGRIEYIDRPTLYYRQHGSNEAGAVRYSLRYFTGRLSSLGRTTELLRRVVAQAGAFLDSCGRRLPAEKRELVEAFSTVLDRSRLARPWVLISHGLMARGALRNLGILALLVFMGQRPGSSARPVKEA